MTPIARTERLVGSFIINSDIKSSLRCRRFLVTTNETIKANIAHTLMFCLSACYLVSAYERSLDPWLGLRETTGCNGVIRVSFII